MAPLVFLALGLLPFQVSTQLTSPILPNDTGAVLNTQNISGPSFIGSEASPRRLQSRTRFLPEVTGFHLNGGNSRESDWHAPTGRRPETGSRSIGISVQYWQDEFRLIARSVCNGTRPYFCMAAMDPITLEPLASWAPENQTLFSPYGEVINSTLVFPTLEGHIFQIQRDDTADGTIFRQLLDIDLSELLPIGHSPVSTMYDIDGNLWFSATPIPGMGSTDNSSRVGFVDPSGKIHMTEIENQMAENSMAVHGKTMYINTGPHGVTDHNNATGYMFAFEADIDQGVQTIWAETYSAGSGLKPGGFARGSGSSPSLVGDRYVAITDNADEQINLVVYHQAHAFKMSKTQGGSSFVCQVPLFKPNASANENAMISHVEGSTYSVIINNNYGAPAMQSSVSDEVNGIFNSFESLAPGIDRVDITNDGRCILRWESLVRSTSVLSLSTNNGIVYTYTQDDKLALNGQYVWYFTAINYTTGEELWRAKSGSGGNYNNNFSPTQLAPNGALYQVVAGGVAWLKNGA